MDAYSLPSKKSRIPSSFIKSGLESNAGVLCDATAHIGRRDDCAGSKMSVSLAGG
jgi:hypothetical protein